MKKTAIILGATGLTGGILLEKLLKDPDYEKVKLFSRSSVNNPDPKIEEYYNRHVSAGKRTAEF